MIRVCEIRSRKFETKSSTRIYCYKCSGESTRSNYKTRKHQKNNIKKKNIINQKVGVKNESINIKFQ